MWSGIYQSLTPPFKDFFNLNQGGGAWAPVALSYASDSGAARSYQRGAKGRERSDQAGEGGGEIFLKICVWKRHFLAH